MEAKKIYIVTEGSYSEYHIEAVFSTREKAEEFMDTKDDEAEIEEFPLDAPVERNVTTWEIGLDLVNKNIRSVKSWTSRQKDLVMIGGTSLLADKENIIVFTIESDSRERAIKIASERFGAVIANERMTYPFLRAKVLKGKYGHNFEYPAYNFKTGAIVLEEWQQMGSNMPDWVTIELAVKHK